MVVADLFYFVLAVFLVRPCMQPRAVVPSGWCAVTRDYDLIRRVGGGRVGVGSRLGRVDALASRPGGGGASLHPSDARGHRYGDWRRHYRRRVGAPGGARGSVAVSGRGGSGAAAADGTGCAGAARDGDGDGHLARRRRWHSHRRATWTPSPTLSLPRRVCAGGGAPRNRAEGGPKETKSHFQRDRLDVELLSERPLWRHELLCLMHECPYILCFVSSQTVGLLSVQ